MKRISLSLALISSLVLVYNVWIDVETPITVEHLNNDLDQHAIAYQVIDGTPLILAEFGGRYFLDTIRMERVSMRMPPTPRWQWTGNWELVSNPDSPATANLSSAFGPTVLYGLVMDDSIVTVRVERGDELIQDIPVDGGGFIVQSDGVKLSDTVLFLDSEGNVIASCSLMKGEQFDQMV